MSGTRSPTQSFSVDNTRATGSRGPNHRAGKFQLLSVAKAPSALEPLPILPRAWILPGAMLRLLVALLPTLRSAMRSRRDLVIGNLTLRQQLVTLARRRHPDIRPADRVFWVLLRRSWNRWAEALAIVRPDTFVRWHCAEFRHSVREKQ